MPSAKTLLKNAAITLAVVAIAYRVAPVRKIVFSTGGGSSSVMA